MSFNGKRYSYSCQIYLHLALLEEHARKPKNYVSGSQLLNTYILSPKKMRKKKTDRIFVGKKPLPQIQNIVSLTTDEITSVEPPKMNHLYVSDTGKKTRGHQWLFS